MKKDGEGRRRGDSEGAVHYTHSDANVVLVTAAIIMIRLLLLSSGQVGPQPGGDQVLTGPLRVICKRIEPQLNECRPTENAGTGLVCVCDHLTAHEPTFPVRGL